MKYVEYKIAKNFEEVINDKNSVFEIFIISENGYTIRRRLMKISWYNNSIDYLSIAIYDKVGRVLGCYGVPLENGNNNIGNDIKGNVLRYCGIIFTTSRDYAYNHCMKMLNNKMTDLRRKANKLHESIYTL